MGALATQNTVEVSLENNGKCTLREATAKQAGVLSAANAQLLETLRGMLTRGEIAITSQAVGQAPLMPPVDLSLPPAVEVLPPNHSDQIGRRIQALESNATSRADYANLANAFAAFRTDVAQRIANLEQRVSQLETNDNIIPQEVTQLRLQIQEQQPLLDAINNMVTDPTPVAVESNNGS